MKTESYSINYNEKNWKVTFDYIDKDLKLNFSREEVFSYSTKYFISGSIETIKQDGRKHITSRST